MAESSEIKNVDSIRDFIFAGASRFTLQGREKRFTYRLKQPKDRKDDDRGPWFLQVLTGQDNDSDYQFAGTIWCNGGRYSFKPSPKSRISESAPSVVAFRWFLDAMQFHEDKLDQIKFWHEGRCGRCGRALTVPESIESGLGPVCAGRAS